MRLADCGFQSQLQVSMTVSDHSLSAGIPPEAALSPTEDAAGLSAGKKRYELRLAFDVWANDVRNQAATLANWPYDPIDDKTVDGIVRSLDLQAESGYNVVDLAGLWTTYAWPVDLTKVVDRDRQRRITQILKAVHERKMKVIVFPSGILNWGMDEILRAHPEFQTDNRHEMNPLLEEAWNWQYKIFDYTADNYDIDGYHLEAADQGRCRTPECMARWPDNVAYYCYVTAKLADYLHRKDAGRMLIATLQGFAKWGQALTQEQKAHVVELTKSVDCLFDQGHYKTYIPSHDWKTFIPTLHCPYGTSGGMWIYVNERWERTRWFLPYVQQTGNSIKELYEAGGRGVMYYQGPVANRSTEVNIAFGGRLMNDVDKSVEDVLAEVLESLYQPKKPASLRKLVGIFQQAETSYFAQWNRERIAEFTGRPAPSNFHITNSFGATPGAAEYLMEPYLDTSGRLKYKRALVEMYTNLEAIQGDFEDKGRIRDIKRGIAEALVDINNISYCKNEAQVWDDRKVGLQY
jgi:hypothetical protein